MLACIHGFLIIFLVLQRTHASIEIEMTLVSAIANHACTMEREVDRVKFHIEFQSNVYYKIFIEFNCKIATTSKNQQQQQKNTLHFSI